MYSILQRQNLVPKTHLFKVAASEVAEKARAGQFVVIRIDEQGECIPLTSDDPRQLAQVTAALDMPVTIGETYGTKYGFRTLIEKKAGDIFMIDIQRVGGVSEWIKAAAIAQAWNIPVANHLYPGFSVHLVGAVPNGLILEYMPWWDKIYKEPYKVVDGCIQVPESLGLGLDLDQAAVEKFRI